MRRTLLISLLLTLLGTIFVAVPVLAYTYRAPVAVTNNSTTTSYTMLPIAVSVNNTSLIDNGFMQVNGLDSRIETLGGADKPHMVADNATYFAVPVSASSQVNLYYSLGNSDLTTMPMVFGYGGYCTVIDDPVLEPTDNFSIESSLYIVADDAIQSNVVSKYDSGDGGLEIFADSGNITAWIAQASTDNVILRPNGTGDVTNISNVTGASTHWEAVSDANDASEVHQNSTSYLQDLYTLDNSGYYGPIDSVNFYFRIKSNGGTVWATPCFKIDGVTYNGTEQTATIIATKNQLFAASPATGTSWSWSEINSMQVGIFLKGNTNSEYCYDIWLVVTYHDSVVITSAITDEEHEISIGAIGSSENTTYRPTGDGSINDFYGTDHYLKVDEEVADNYTTYIQSSTHYYTFINLAIKENGVVTYTSDNKTIGYWPTWNSVNETWTTRPSDGLPFTGNDINNLEFGIKVPNGQVELFTISSSLPSVAAVDSVTVYAVASYTDAIPGGYGTMLTQVYVVVNYSEQFSMAIDGDVVDSVSLGGTSVPDNSSDWVFGSSATPYINSCSIIIGGNPKSSYAPVTVVRGTNLPNTTTPGSYNGTIVWGSNPAGVSVSLGGLVSAGQPEVGETLEEISRDLLPNPTGTSDWFAEPDVSGSLLTNPLRPLITMVSDNTTMTEIQVWRYFGLVVVVLVTVMAVKAVPRHLVIAAVAAGVATVGMVVWTVWPLWALALLALYAIGGFVSERSPSL